MKGAKGSHIKTMLERWLTAGPVVHTFGTRMQIRLHVNVHSWLKN